MLSVLGAIEAILDAERKGGVYQVYRKSKDYESPESDLIRL